MNGRPLTINWIAANSPAILETWFGGTQAGNAIADVLFGDTNPGGKLPVTFPRSVGQEPLYYNHMNTGRPADPGNKYTSKYLDASWTPLYPFGYGLSYTQFRLSNLQVSAKANLPLPLTVSVEVENTGRRAGDEVVQLYIRDVAASITRQQVPTLVGFPFPVISAFGAVTSYTAFFPNYHGVYTENWNFNIQQAYSLHCVCIFYLGSARIQRLTLGKINKHIQAVGLLCIAAFEFDSN